MKEIEKFTGGFPEPNTIKLLVGENGRQLYVYTSTVLENGNTSWGLAKLVVTGLAHEGYAPTIEELSKYESE